LSIDFAATLQRLSDGVFFRYGITADPSEHCLRHVAECEGIVSPNGVHRSDVR
jgi:hypothetical protein